MAGIPGLDRRAMEAERLARMEAKQPKTSEQVPSTMPPMSAKRQRSISPPATSRPVKKIKERENTSDLLHYPRGAVKKTWAFGHTRSANDIKIEEVLEKSTLRTALFSAFQWDTNWIMAKLNLHQTKVIMVMQADNEAVKQQYRRETEYLGKILRLVFPSMEGNVNCMHSKLMLLFHPHKLRVVIPTANMTDYDWGEQGTMENSVFLIDLPRLEQTTMDDANALPQFGRELHFFLQKMGCEDDILKGVLNFDFSNTEHLAFVHSIGASAHYGEDMERTGYVGLSKAVRELNHSSECSLSSTSNLNIDYVASSIGSLNDAFLAIIHNAARGENATATPKSLSGSAPKPFQNTISTTNIRDLFRMYYPLHSTVTSSKAGSAGTICLKSDWWSGAPFPRECFRDYRSKRSGILSHNKILYARGVNDKGQQIAWQYVGSANLSESAWGKLSWDKKRKEWKLGCRNWECGVIMPVSIGDTEVKQKTKAEVPSMEVFGVENIPFEYPGAGYDGKDPWFTNFT
ncbi:phospholipase D/nuclease [Aureobasidium namibiae CBS 147.97]|uniref:Phospholipase D/nuclease n=1 Tax=Aureobasidium namibiae CBS 147.97 TaxID=1043004 RepID=A0A074WYA0_9PEZI|nr:phospholipase D/nuclease [Aureobasidium namibiae CBS 147.97]KEQ78133.1 phospholipase D/nuclease [Aureobasidium namibiae CBS 147.97]